jgi:hypothetical protein
MKKARLIAGMAAAIPAAGAFAVPAAAHTTQATTALAHQAPANGKTVLHYGIPDTGTGWYEVSTPATLYFTTGGTYPNYQGVGVYVTCYYSGAPGPDPYWDHFTKYISPTRGGGVTRSRTGHVADRHVDLNGHFPNSYGIRHC